MGLSLGSRFDADAVSRLLSGLLGRDVFVRPGRALSPSPSRRAALGVYAGSGGRAGAVWICDIPLAASLGAALSLLAPSAAEECIRSGRLSEAVFGNFSEVLNIGATLISETVRERMTLRNAIAEVPPVPVDAAWIILRPVLALHAEVSVAEYPPGRMSFLSALS